MLHKVPLTLNGASLCLEVRCFLSGCCKKLMATVSGKGFCASDSHLLYHSARSPLCGIILFIISEVHETTANSFKDALCEGCLLIFGK